MEKYIVRVQFSNENTQRYTMLRDRLIKAGFTKNIVSNEKVAYCLPRGNYYVECTNTPTEVLGIVKRAALPLDTNAMILVTKVSKDAGSLTWVGLPYAK